MCLVYSSPAQNPKERSFCEPAVHSCWPNLALFVPSLPSLIEIQDGCRSWLGGFLVSFIKEVLSKKGTGESFDGDCEQIFSYWKSLFTVRMNCWAWISLSCCMPSTDQSINWVNLFDHWIIFFGGKPYQAGILVQHIIKIKTKIFHVPVSLRHPSNSSKQKGPAVLIKHSLHSWQWCWIHRNVEQQYF